MVIVQVMGLPKKKKKVSVLAMHYNVQSNQ